MSVKLEIQVYDEEDRQQDRGTVRKDQNVTASALFWVVRVQQCGQYGCREDQRYGRRHHQGGNSFRNKRFEVEAWFVVADGEEADSKNLCNATCKYKINHVSEKGRPYEKGVYHDATDEARFRYLDLFLHHRSDAYLESKIIELAERERITNGAVSYNNLNSIA